MVMTCGDILIERFLLRKEKAGVAIGPTVFVEL